jgi:hypothetical protein
MMDFTEGMSQGHIVYSGWSQPSTVQCLVAALDLTPSPLPRPADVIRPS